LKEFWESSSRYADVEAPLRAWYAEVRRATWKSPTDIKAKYRSASILKSSRVVFNIAGNKYRLVAYIRYDLGRIYVRFVGTHEQYDEIDAETV
jgi:mRNA interferase HigB